MNIERINQFFNLEKIHDYCIIKNEEETAKSVEGSEENLCREVYFKLTKTYLELKLEDIERQEKNFLKEIQKDSEKIKELIPIINDDFYKQKCDGFLIQYDNRLVIVIELKRTFNESNFKHALKQIIATYLKVISFWSIIYQDFFNFEPIFIFGFRNKKKISEEKMKYRDLEFIEDSKDFNPTRLYFKIYRKLERYSTPICVKIPRIPFKKEEKVNPNLQKQNVKLLVIKCGRCYPLEEIINICQPKVLFS